MGTSGKPPTEPPGLLEAVGVGPGGTAWAVGGSQGLPLALHLEGGAWRSTGLPTPPAGRSTLLGAVAADGPAHDAWSVGSLENLDTGNQRPVVYSWDGQRWEPLSLPGADRRIFDFLYTVAGTASDDVWVAGEGGRRRVEDGLLLHWDGTSWQRSPGIREDSLVVTSMSAPKADDVVAAGYYFVDVWYTRPFLERWDGTAWKNMNVPALGGTKAANRLSAVSVVGPDDIWAVGTTTPHARTSGIIDHWNGKRWTVSSFVVPGYANVQLYGVSFAGPNDGWLVGSAAQGKTSLLFAARWTKQGWQTKTLGKSDVGYAELSGVSTASPDRAYAVGYQFHHRKTVHPLIYTWNGKTWSQQQ